MGAETNVNAGQFHRVEDANEYVGILRSSRDEWRDRALAAEAERTSLKANSTLLEEILTALRLDHARERQRAEKAEAERNQLRSDNKRYKRLLERRDESAAATDEKEPTDG